MATSDAPTAAGVARAAAVLAVILAAALMPAAPADAKPAQDRRPCVSKGELEWLLEGGVATKREIETHWEVRGRGKRMLERPLDRGGSFTVAYPACGYNRSEVWVAVKYTWWREWRYAWLYDDREL